MKIFALIFSTILVILWSSLAFSESAHEMLSECRPIAKAEVSGGYVKFPQDYQTGICWGAFSVIQKIIVHTDDNGRIYRVCAPANGTLSQLISVFVDYAEKNPQRLHEDFFNVVLDSLRKAFPCKRKNRLSNQRLY